MQKRYVLGALVAGVAGLLTGTASAQDASGSVEASAATAEPQEDAQSEESQDPMGWIGIGLKVGAGGTGEGEFEVSTPAGTVVSPTPSRAGFQISVPINMGGDGFGWMLEPYMNFDDVTATGLYTGPTFNFHVMDPLYVGFGFGLKFAYLSADTLDMGLDVGGRVPITGTYYLIEDVGLVAELGLGYTSTGIKTKAPLISAGSGTTAPESSLSFGSAFAWDFSVGARWP